MTTLEHIRIEHRETTHIAYVRHVGPYTDVGEAWKKLMKWGWSKMIFGKPDTFGLCYDDPDTTPADRLRYDACLVVKPNTKTKGDVRTKTLLETTYAVLLHEGPLELLSRSYAALFACIASQRIDGRTWSLGDPPSLERYLTDPRKVEPSDMRTEICMPVTPAKAGAAT